MKKILVANRGEIALRIMRTIKKMGIKTVAIYSEADTQSPHVLFADEAVCVGPPPSSESYLKMDTIIKHALQLGVDGIHPGYGFLSENAVFAQKVTDAGINFIGPPPSAIETMGSKLAAKAAVAAYDIPLVPGTEQAITNVKKAISIAEKIGYPILIKASAGGGGKGMRLVENAKELPEQMQMAINEAQSAFGDGAVFIEKFVRSPRHIELQIMADTHGNVVHLFERECSIQRRHQKVVEEAPSAVLTPELREKMGQSAVNVARSCNYVGAGTVEFLIDDQLNYYFLEMNTRLQVEHPVTEMITGVDLVQEQITVAMGKPLSFTQQELNITGHAIELRVYAEDPMNNFLPDIGTLHTYQPPEGEGIRVDDSFTEGMDIPIYYDPMIAKLVVYADTRAAAIEKMKYAIKNYHIDGIANTLGFGNFVMHHQAFKTGQFDTGFVKQYFNEDSIQLFTEQDAETASILAVFLQEKYKNESKLEAINVAKFGEASKSNWKIKRCR